jgi:hypothetical protein
MIVEVRGITVLVNGKETKEKPQDVVCLRRTPDGVTQKIPHVIRVDTEAGIAVCVKTDKKSRSQVTLKDGFPTETIQGQFTVMRKKEYLEGPGKENEAASTEFGDTADEPEREVGIVGNGFDDDNDDST